MTLTTIAPAATATEELVRVDAANIVLEENIRDHPEDALVEDWFVDSVRQHGVLQAVLGYRNDLGQIVVRDGQLRVLAARLVGCTVPVLIGERPLDVVHRVTEQYVTNERRTGLTDHQKVAAFRQLELGGLSVTAIAKQTSTSKEQVKASLTVAKSVDASTALAGGQISFDTALVLAEFDGDAAAIAELSQIAEGDFHDLEYAAEQIRQERVNEAKRLEVVADFEAAGVRVATDEDSYESVHRLTNAEPTDTVRPPLDAEEHKTCPGHAVTVVVYHGDDVRVSPVCCTPEAHQPRWASFGSTPAQAGPMTDEQKAERKTLIKNNKAWDAAETVRRTFVTTLMTRKNLPKDAAVFTALTLTRHHQLVTADSGDYARTFTGSADKDQWGLKGLATLVEQTPTKAQTISLAIALSAFENAIGRDSWRYPSDTGKEYLNQLELWGHHLCPVERIAAGHPAPADDDTDAAVDEDTVTAE